MTGAAHGFGRAVCCALAQGGGFGIAWTYLVRRSVEGVGEDEKERIAAAIPTVQRYGYALGAALAMGVLSKGPVILLHLMPAMLLTPV